MINKAGSEIKIMGYIMLIFIIIAITGIFAYKGFQSILAEVSHSSEPDTKISLVKEIVSDISVAENNVKSYNLTRDKKYLSPFYNSVLVIDKNINELKRLTGFNKEQEKMVTEMEGLIDRKYNVLNELLSLYPDENITAELFKISERINHEAEVLNNLKIKQNEAASVKLQERKTFFQRLFGKASKEQKIDSAALVSEKANSQAKINLIQNNIKKEIEKVNRQHVDQQKLVKQNEFRLTNAGEILMSQIVQITNGIERSEKEVIANKIDHAAVLATETNRLVAVFCMTAGLLLVIVSIVLVKFIQKKKAYEKVLQDGKDQAEALASSKETFLANMSHEIRTPMNAITGFTNQILKTELQPEQREQLKIVQKSNEHLLRIVNDILDYSKIQAGKFSFECVSFNPDKVMKEAIELLSPLVKNKKVIINYKANRLPEAVVGDPVRLRQILFNLLGNSIKFTDRGEIEIKVEFEKGKEERINLHLCISDTGIGIPEGKLKEVFNEFEQANNDISYKYAGTGLGLPITKKLVELQDGSIDIQSKDGRGTTITIIIPYNESTAACLYYKQSGKPVIADEMQLKSLKVLIADDDEYNRKLLNVILKKWNAEVREARNGKEVIEEVMNNPFDILLIDIRMPEMNGIEAAKLIRNMKNGRSETPIIALTAVTTEEKKHERRHK